MSKSGATTTTTLLCTSGIFELYFETGSGMENTTIAIHNERRAILCQAFQDISDFINTPLKNSGNITKIKIWIRSPTSLGLPANAGGGASAFYNIPLDGVISAMGPPIRGIVDNEIWKTIHTGTDSFNNTVFPIISTQTNAGFYHGYACFNFAGTVNWNLDYTKYNASTAYPLNYIDFYSTIIHEVTHALGFNSLINYNGESNLFINSNGLRFGRYFTRYDKNLKTSSTISLITNIATTGGQMYDFSFNTGVPLNSLYPSCSLIPQIFNGNSGTFNCATSLKYVGSITVPIYNPACFEQGSSLSHFEDACYNGTTNDQYFVMSDRASGLFAKRTLTTEERQVLCDIGYSVNGTFGNRSNFTYKDYGITGCTGITVAGVNDGFTTTGAYAFQGNSGTDIAISGILNNDYTGGLLSNLRFEFVQDLYDPNAIFSVTNGNNSTLFTIKTFVPGLHLLRYVPFDNLTGQRGNITYIYVNVFNNCAVNNPCSLVRNGNFEDHNFAPDRASQIYKACGWQNASYLPSSDYFNSDSSNSSISIPSNMFGNQSDKIAGNHAYAGMFISPRINYLEYVFSESIKTELINSLLPNTQYQLTFDVSMADNYLTNSIKFQAFITDTNLELTTGGIIPISNITSDKVFLTNQTFSGSASANTWETITFTFTTGSNANLKYLYIGGLSNVQFQGTGESYYYVDNVSLTRVLAPDFLDAVNDDYFNYQINSIYGGSTLSVYSNDLYNNLPTYPSSLSNVTFELVNPISISGATINNMGLINIPAGTAAGIYTLTYRLSIIGNCTISDLATVKIVVVKDSPTSLAPGIRADNLVLCSDLQSTGNIIIAGQFFAYNNITVNRFVRLKENLTLDQSFNMTGASPANICYAADLKVQNDDKIIVTGYFDEFGGGNGGKSIARLMPNVDFDATFNNGGEGLGPQPGSEVCWGFNIAIQPDGKILVGGYFYSFNGEVRKGIVRINRDGTIDDTFDPVELNTYYESSVFFLTLQPDGKILLSGVFQLPVPGPVIRHLIRLESDGSIDNSFRQGDLTGSNNHYDTSTSLNRPLAKTIVQPDGKIIVLGAFTKYNGNTTNNIVRLNENGTVDNGFYTATGTDRAINVGIIEPNSNFIIVGGEFTSFGSSPVKKMIRLKTDGSLDPSFSIGTGTTDGIVSNGNIYAVNYVKYLKRQPDGKIIVGGKFTTFNGLSATNITRILGDAGVQAKSSVIEYQSEPEIDINFSNRISIYPNPSDGIYYFNLIEVDTDTQIQVLNLLGEQVFSGVLKGKQENKIDLSNLAQGCYLVKLSNSKSTTTQKLIKK